MQRDLVERARKGDHDAFAELAAATISRLDDAAWLVLRDPEQAKDAVQNVLVRAWRDLPTLRDPDRFDAWLHRLLVNACHREAGRGRRRNAIEVHVSMLEAPQPDPNLGLFDRDELERGFRRLKTDQRAVLVLHYYVGLPLDDVARALGVPKGTVRSRLHRATQAMRAGLEADARLQETDGRRLA